MSIEFWQSVLYLQNIGKREKLSPIALTSDAPADPACLDEGSYGEFLQCTAPSDQGIAETTDYVNVSRSQTVNVVRYRHWSTIKIKNMDLRNLLLFEIHHNFYTSVSIWYSNAKCTKYQFDRIIPAKTHVARKRNIIGNHWLSSYAIVYRRIRYSNCINFVLKVVKI